MQLQSQSQLQCIQLSRSFTTRAAAAPATAGTIPATVSFLQMPMPMTMPRMPRMPGMPRMPMPKPRMPMSMPMPMPMPMPRMLRMPMPMPMPKLVRVASTKHQFECACCHRCALFATPSRTMALKTNSCPHCICNSSKTFARNSTAIARFTSCRQTMACRRDTRFSTQCP